MYASTCCEAPSRSAEERRPRRPFVDRARVVEPRGRPGPRRRGAALGAPPNADATDSSAAIFTRLDSSLTKRSIRERISRSRWVLLMRRVGQSGADRASALSPKTNPGLQEACPDEKPFQAEVKNPKNLIDVERNVL